MPTATTFPEFLLVALIVAMVLCTAVPRFAAGSDEPVDWQNMTDVQQVYEAYPERTRQLFEALDLTRPGLEAVRAAVEAGDLPAASRALLAYYRTHEAAASLRAPMAIAVRNDWTEADEIVNDQFTARGLKDEIPRRADGRYNWVHAGPNNDGEWRFYIHRMIPLTELALAWRHTQDEKYAQKFDRIIRDWTTAHPHDPPQEGAAYASAWHRLNAGIRAGHWPTLFHGFQDAEGFSDGARLLMLIAVPEHAQYILKNQRRRSNFITMQMHGLARLGLWFPEFKAAGHWVDTVRTVLGEELSDQVYPDGAQKELTAFYHLWGTLRWFQSTAEQIVQAGHPIDEEYQRGLERMWNYAAYVSRPDGGLPQNNDSDSTFAHPRLIEQVDTFNRADWRYIATQGEAGERPAGPPSRFFPWAGQLVSRSGWTRDAHWSFFDVGPWGIGHQHNDAMHLSVYAHGRELLVDSGRFAYGGKIARRFRNAYARHSRGHNVILLDERGQGPAPQSVNKPIADQAWAITDDYDFASSSFANFGPLRPGVGGEETLAGEATHHRAVLYLRGVAWVVVDRIDTDRPRDVQALWHFHPDCTTQLQGSQALTTDENAGNLRIVPSDNMTWTPSIIKGQDEPYPQGWYSVRTNAFEPSPVAVYRTRIESGSTFAWLLLPAEGDVPAASLKLLSADAASATLELRIGDAAPRRVTVPMTGHADAVRVE